jgi:hypothetical protein
MLADSWLLTSHICVIRSPTQDQELQRTVFRKLQSSRGLHLLTVTVFCCSFISGHISQPFQSQSVCRGMEGYPLGFCIEIRVLLAETTQRAKETTQRAEGTTPQAAALFMPEAVLLIDDEGDEIDDFKVALRFGPSCLAFDYPCGICRRRRGGAATGRVGERGRSSRQIYALEQAVVHSASCGL